MNDMRKKLPYKEPIIVELFECPYCHCRLESRPDYDSHYEEQHGKHGLPFCISMSLPPTENNEGVENDRTS